MYGGGGQERYRALNSMALRSSALGGDSDDESVSYINVYLFLTWVSQHFLIQRGLSLHAGYNLIIIIWHCVKLL